MPLKDLLELTPDEYKLERKIQNLRQRINERTKELNITTDHSTDSHYYVRDNAKYPSVTSKLKMLKDQGLTSWKLNRAMDFIFQNFPQITNDNLLEMLDKAKNAPQLEFEGAGNIGRTVHGWREVVFRNMMDGHDLDYSAAIDIGQTMTPPIISGCRAIKKFVKDVNYIPVACELSLADHLLKLGGQLDDIGFVNGELSLVDLKTSNIGDKNSYFHQVALYYLMFWRAYKIRPKKFYILHVSKTDGTYNLIEIKNMTQLIKEAKLVLKLSDALDRLSASKKKERVVIT